MDLSLELEPASPLYAGGARGGGAYGEGLGYVPAPVLRAALARAITAACAYVDPQGRAADGLTERLFWVQHRGGAACGPCPWRTWCRHFAALRPGDALPAGAEVVPRTALQCKQNPEAHPLQDDLPRRLRLQLQGEGVAAAELRPPCCPVCGGRTEAAEGLMRNGRILPEAEGPVRLLQTHVGLDPGRRAARPAILYSTAVIAPTAQRGTPLRLQAPVRVPEARLEPAERDPAAWRIPQDELTVGARTSTGLGRCRVRVGKPVPALPPLEERLQAVQRQLDLGGEAWYAPVRLLADAAWSLPAHDLPTPAAAVATADFLALLARGLGLRAPGWTLIRADAEHVLRSGWDTAVPGGARRPLQLFTLRGAMVVLRCEGRPDAAALAALRRWEEEGIGARRDEGLGVVRVGLVQPAAAGERGEADGHSRG